jgi:hypothetical protein
MLPLLSALPLFLSKEVRPLLSLRAALPFVVVIGLIATPTASAESANGDGHKVHASGGGATALTYPSIVNSRLVRGEKTLERAGDYVDRDQPDKAITSLLNARRNMYAAWRGAKYVIDHAPPPAPVESGSVRRVRSGSVHKSGGAVGPALATPPDTAFAVLSYQHDVATTAFGMIDGAKGTLLKAVNTTIFAALNRRDQAIDYIHKVAPPAPPVESGSLRAKREDAVHKSGGAVATTFDTVMPGLIPQFDDELQQIGAQVDGGAVVPTGKKILNDAQAQVTKTEATVNQYWPPLPADG